VCTIHVGHYSAARMAVHVWIHCLQHLENIHIAPVSSRGRETELQHILLVLMLFAFCRVSEVHCVTGRKYAVKGEQIWQLHWFYTCFVSAGQLTFVRLCI